MSRTVLSLALSAALVGCGGSKLVDDGNVTASSGPSELRVTSPDVADWVDAGPLEVKGVARGLTSVTVNGKAAAVVNGEFTATIEAARGIQAVEVLGEEADGDTLAERFSVIAGDFADPSETLEEAIALRVNLSGLDFAMGQIETIVAGMDLNDSLTAVNPVYSDSYGIFGIDAVNVNADIGFVWYEPVQLDVRPQEGVLRLTATIPDFEVWTPVYGEIVGFDFSEDAWVWASSVEIVGDIVLDTDLNGKLSAKLVKPAVTLEGFGYDTSLLPGNIESYILVDTLQGILEDKLTTEITARVPGLLEDQLSALDLSFETELLERELEVSAEFADVGVDNGGIYFLTDVDMHIAGDGDKVYQGYLESERGLPELARQSDLAAGLHDDLLNRALFEAWRAGMLDLSMNTADGSMSPLMLIPLKATEGSMVLEAGLPPVIVERSGELWLEAGEMVVDLETPGGEFGDRVKFALNLEAKLDLFVEDGEIVIDIGEPAVKVAVREHDWGGSSNETITSLLQEMLPIDALLILVGDLRFPLPTLAGIGIASAKVDRDESGAHTDVKITLD